MRFLFAAVHLRPLLPTTSSLQAVILRRTSPSSGVRRNDTAACKKLYHRLKKAGCTSIRSVLCANKTRGQHKHRLYGNSSMFSLMAQLSRLGACAVAAALLLSPASIPAAVAPVVSLKPALLAD